MKTHNLTLEYLENLPTLHQGQFDNLKMDNGKQRVWLSRMTVDDGMPYNNQITIEEYREIKKKGYTDWQWVTVYTYEAK